MTNSDPPNKIQNIHSPGDRNVYSPKSNAFKKELGNGSSISWNRTNEIANPMNHPTGVFRFRTIELILSVTDANVSPGAITGAVV